MTSREPTDRTVLPDAAVRAALRELRDVGGDKQYIYCRFGWGVASHLVARGWATMDDGPTKDAVVHITVKGRLAIIDG